MNDSKLSGEAKAAAFVLDALSVSTAAGIQCHIRSGIDGAGTLDSTKSDVDIMCSCVDEVKKLEIIITGLEQKWDAIRILSKNASRDSRLFIYSFEGSLLQLDISCNIRAENFVMMSGATYFALMRAGVSLDQIVPAIKEVSNFRGSWPRMPEYYFTVERRKINKFARTLVYVKKLLRIAGGLARKRTGVVIACLGPDGVGKSAVISGVIDELNVKRALLPCKSFHFSAGIAMRLRASSSDTSRPHAMAVRGQMPSIVKLAYYAVDHMLGFALSVLPALHRDHVVLFDRYFHDVKLDPVRYRYGGPIWLVRLFSCIVPHPDLFVYFDAPPETVISRKREITLQQAQKQREAYASFIRDRSDGVTVDASGPLDEVISETLKIIVNELELRGQR